MLFRSFAAGDESGRPLRGAPFRDALANSGVQFLAASEPGDPAGTAWTQTNSIDSLGHGHGHKLVDLLDAELAAIASRIDDLIDAGWQRVVIVTDHGWLLPAKPARKVELPLHLTEGDSCRKPRVARLKIGQDVDLPTLPWTWDPTVTMATPPGVASFVAGTIYEHGGLSPQECIIPVITVTADGTNTIEAHIGSFRWIKMRCRIDFATPLPGMSVELRTAPGDPSTRLAGPVVVGDGDANLLVKGFDNEGVAAYIVLLDDAGTVIDQRSTHVGETP